MKGAVLRTLQAIDWDFASPRAGYVAPPHWYPGTFVPALSESLIEALTPPGGTVFDPYGGIGTTGWSAMRMGRSCHIADVNPVALLVAYVTNSLLALKRADKDRAIAALGTLGRVIGRNDDLFSDGEEAINGQHIEALVETLCSPTPKSLLAKLVVGPPQWQLLKDWIAPETLTDLSVLVENIHNCESAYIRLLGLSMVSATVRSVSSQHASWGHIADNVRPKKMLPQNIYSATTRWLKRTRAFLMLPMVNGYAQDKSIVKPKIHIRDWSKSHENGPGDADLLLTSPPYADAIDYTLAQRLSLYILGYDDAAIQRLVSSEIGARRKRFKSVSRADWSRQLCEALANQITWLKPEGTICLVLPHKDAGRRVGEDDLKSAMDNLGWHLFFERDRSIHQSHTRQAWTSIKKETILAFAAV